MEQNPLQFLTHVSTDATLSRVFLSFYANIKLRWLAGLRIYEYHNRLLITSCICHMDDRFECTCTYIYIYAFTHMYREIDGVVLM